MSVDRHICWNGVTSNTRTFLSDNLKERNWQSRQRYMSRLGGAVFATILHLLLFDPVNMRVVVAGVAPTFHATDRSTDRAAMTYNAIFFFSGDGVYTTPGWNDDGELD